MFHLYSQNNLFTYLVNIQKMIYESNFECLSVCSATSFGSFHLIRLLYDEFMFYTVEHKLVLTPAYSIHVSLQLFKSFLILNEYFYN